MLPSTQGMVGESTQRKSKFTSHLYEPEQMGKLRCVEIINPIWQKENSYQFQERKHTKILVMVGRGGSKWVGASGVGGGRWWGEGTQD